MPAKPARIFILGATGSVGSCAIDLIRKNPGEFRLIGACANSSAEKLMRIAEEFQPEYLHLMDPVAYESTNCNNPGINLGSTMDSLLQMLTESRPDIVLAAMVGNIGLLPVIHSLKEGYKVALANKETLVSGGFLVQEIIQNNPTSKILPVDSEHSAIFQCLQDNQSRDVLRILLTASGGTFRTTPVDEMLNITPEDALKHPNWDMGAKITIDSSTMMNKGLEVIEAHYLFQTPYDKIDVIVHPQSIIHSMVEFIDHSIIAQLGVPDMTIPTAYALSYPHRIPLPQVPALDFASMGTLTFENPNYQKFPCLKIAYEAGRRGGLFPAVMNAANEVAVESFLSGKIKFLEIPLLIESVLEIFNPVMNPDLESVLQADQWARLKASEFKSNSRTWSL